MLLANSERDLRGHGLCCSKIMSTRDKGNGIWEDTLINRTKEGVEGAQRSILILIMVGLFTRSLIAANAVTRMWLSLPILPQNREKEECGSPLEILRENKCALLV